MSPTITVAPLRTHRSAMDGAEASAGARDEDDLAVEDPHGNIMRNQLPAMQHHALFLMRNC